MPEAGASARFPPAAELPSPAELGPVPKFGDTRLVIGMGRNGVAQLATGCTGREPEPTTPAYVIGVAAASILEAVEAALAWEGLRRALCAFWYASGQ